MEFLFIIYAIPVLGFPKQTRISNRKHQQENKIENLKKDIEEDNPVGKDGKVLTCFICDSSKHFDNHCPHRDRLKGMKNPRNQKCQICYSVMHLDQVCPHYGEAYNEANCYECALCKSVMHNVDQCIHKLKQGRCLQCESTDHLKTKCPHRYLYCQ